MHAAHEAVAQARRWAWQRLSALVLALCVVVHLVLMIVAVRGGLSAAEILSRTQGSVAFAAFYGLFVLACVVHVPIGLATIAREWGRLSDRAALWLSRGFALVLLVLGLRAVLAVVSPGA
ncbi:MAG: succinate dehydrogenase [Rubrivivax sp.]|nr:succinate dehydrogenase [Rubrivivax sp.]